jgi:hypothetical protein
MAAHQTFDMQELLAGLDEQTQAAMELLKTIKQRGQDVSIGEMFEMQMVMNKLTQFSEMSSSVQAAIHGALLSVARNMK